MNKQELDTKISDVAKSILSYSLARTPNHFEAEDLAQDIIVEIYKSAANIRNDDAFYGFMWSVAGNVYKNWCKKQSKNKDLLFTDNDNDLSNVETDKLIYEINNFDDDNNDVQLLRRELTLLSEKYRRTTILYYIDGKSCQEISEVLSISESMVKYLLFKSRQILKEGMNMERNYGKSSYNPKGLKLLFWGDKNIYYNLCDSKISQNILMSCYNDKLTADEISLEIGVALPYMEENLKELHKYELLKKDGNRYYTNIFIATKEFSNEVGRKTANAKNKIADIITNAIKDNEAAIRNIGFSGADMKHNTFNWQMTCIILHRAIIGKLQNRIELVYPEEKFGSTGFVWAVEESPYDDESNLFRFGIANVPLNSGDYIQFMDFPINGEMVHHYFFSSFTRTNTLINIAKGNTASFNENDKALAADMVKNGYAISEDGVLSVNAPIFTKEQFDSLMSILDETTELIANEAQNLMDIVTDIIKNHTPSHLKGTAKDMAYFRLFEDAISGPAGILYESKYLLPHGTEHLLPTTYIILN